MVRRFILPSTVRPYQRLPIQDPSSEVVVVSSTQVGKTWMYAAKVLAFLWSQRPRLPFWWCAPTYRQSKAAQRAIWEIGFHAGIILRGPQPPFDRNPPPATVLVNGPSLEYRTWDQPENLMGDPISGAVLDEGGLLYPEAHASISTRRSYTLGPLWWIGNPGITTGPFRKAASRAQRDGRLYHWTWKTLHEHYVQSGQTDRAAAYLKFIEGERDTLIDYEFRRLYEAEWTEDEAALFRGVHECVDGDWHLGAEDDRFVVGVDVGQVVDYMAVVSFGLKTRRIELRDRFRGVPFPVAAVRLQALQQELRGAPFVVEANNQGLALTQEFDRLGVQYVPFVTTHQSKQELILGLAGDIQGQRVKIGDHEPMPYELAIYRYTRAERAVLYHYGAPPGDHDDTVIAAALARWGAAHVVTDLSAYGWM